MCKVWFAESIATTLSVPLLGNNLSLHWLVSEQLTPLLFKLHLEIFRLLSVLRRNFVIRYDVFALLKLENHLWSSFQGVDDIKIWSHDFFSMLQSLLEGSNIQNFGIVFHKPASAYMSWTSDFVSSASSHILDCCTSTAACNLLGLTAVRQQLTCLH